MTTRGALNAFKRDREQGLRFPGERPTAEGLHSGGGERLVFVARDGSLRDDTYALTKRGGIDRSRFGIRFGDEIEWFDGMETVRQEYFDDTRLVITDHEGDRCTVRQCDLTVDSAHVTHVEVRGEFSATPSLCCFVGFTPEGQDGRVGNLEHDGVLEVFHDREHDYLTASTGLSRVLTQEPDRFEEVIGEGAIEFPRETGTETREDDRLTGLAYVEAPLDAEGEGIGHTTLVSYLADHEETDRPDALAEVRSYADHYPTDRQMRTTAERRTPVPQVVGEGAPAVVDDLRTLSLLAGPLGGRIRGPDTDPYYRFSGGYGYVWFRDDATAALGALDATGAFGLDLSAWHEESAAFYCETQCADGTWPQRVWAHSGRLAPGWAHGQLEEAGRFEQQSDATASVVAVLARVLREAAPEDERRIVATVEAGVDALDHSLAQDGLPHACQNAWEDANGRFAHTAATFLLAYSELVRAPLSAAVTDHAADRAERIYDAIDDLWCEERGVYAVRLHDGEREDRLDASTLALVSAHLAYDAASGVDDERVARLESHVGTTLDGLFREPSGSEVAGVVRYEGDAWRRAEQDGEKVSTLATALAAEAAAGLSTLVDSEEFAERARDLLALLDRTGPLSGSGGALPEQLFDDGSPDSTTPSLPSHGYRLSALARLRGAGALSGVAGEGGRTAPAARPTWTTGETFGVGTVADHGEDHPSRVWFTLTEGALCEPRFPRADLMNLRTLDFLVVDRTEGSTYTARTHAERRESAASTIERATEMVGSDALVFEQVVEETGGPEDQRWRLSVEYAADPEGDALCCDLSFAASDGRSYDLYAVADTALSNWGMGDSGTVVETEGGYALTASEVEEPDEPHVLSASGEPFHVACALAADRTFDAAYAGFAGSDRITTLFDEGTFEGSGAEEGSGNALLVGRVGEAVGSVTDTLALGFAEERDEDRALSEALGTLDRGYPTVREGYVASWRAYLDGMDLPGSVAGDADLAAQYRAALMTLRAVEDKVYLGASLASPSVPWGEAVPSDRARDFGYNFVWARDVYQVFTALLLAGDVDTAREALEYVYAYQQRENGFLPQNTYLDGRTRWGGEQMDNIAFPSVMAYHLREAGLGFEDVDYDYEHVRRSAEYVLENGPYSGQERWEEEAGYSPSTIAAEVTGLACAAVLAEDADEEDDALAFLATADAWADAVESLTVTDEGTPDLEPPYYVRVSRTEEPDEGSRRSLANGGPTLDERAIVDAGFLELVRLGVRSADDPVIERSVAVVDETIRVETPHGPGWYRYVGDGYGERGEESDDEGGPWEGDGRGRLWPIFTGERAEYELRRGTEEGPLAPERLLRTMQGFANGGRMIPEQVWDREYGTEYGWAFGEGTGAATPLAWSMAGFVRLAHAIDAGEPVETPRFVRERYVESAEREPPVLEVTVTATDGALAVSGRTDGDRLLVRIAGETHGVDPEEDGSFSLETGVGTDRAEVVVIAASGGTLPELATSRVVRPVDLD